MDFKSSLGRGRLGARARAPQHRAVSRVSFCWCSGRSECVPPRGKGSVCQWYAAGRCCHRPSLRERLPAGVLWQSGPAVQRVQYLTECIGQGRQVPVAHPTGVQLGDEGGQCVGPRWTAWGYQHLLDHGGGFVDLDDPVDDLHCGAPRGGCTGEFPGPVTT